MNEIKEQIDRELETVKADETVLREAKRAAQGGYRGNGSGRRRRKLVAVCLAATLVLGGITAAASGIFGNFTDYFTGDMEMYRDQLLSSASQTSNEDYVMGIDGVMSDDLQCMFVWNLEARSADGQDKLKEFSGKHSILPDHLSITAVYKDGTRESVSGFSTFRYLDLQSNKAISRVITIKAQRIGRTNIDDVEKFEVSFQGLKLDAVRAEPLQSLGLNAGGGDGAAEEHPEIWDVTLSPLGFSFRSSVEEINVRLIRNDGTLEKEEDTSYSYGFSRENPDAPEEPVWVFGDFRYEILNLSDYQGLRINGVDYIK